MNESNVPAIHNGSTEVATADQWLTPDQVVQRLELVKDTQRKAMKEGTHYGKIPGCGPKPVLLKPGAEVLNMLCQFRADEARVDIKEYDGAHREYTITVVLRDRQGNVAGSGTGSCSTLESKYRYIRGKERKDIADTYNTVLKMAHKRAYVAATLFACSASDLFTQDIEENPEMYQRAPAAPVNDAEYQYGYELPYRKKGVDMNEVRAHFKQHGARFDGEMKIWKSTSAIPQGDCKLDPASVLVMGPDAEQPEPAVEVTSFDDDEINF